jgi:hypothetical protein
MDKKQILLAVLVVIVSVFVFVVVYYPHYQQNPYPYHLDEWHHITEALKLRAGDYSGGVNGFEIGFHAILMVFSYFVDLVKVYQFFPALWAVVSALVLFYVVRRKTNNYWIALLSMVFFASLKSNVNIEGLMFFTPLSFSIPFIFLYVYFFTEGIERENRKMILASIGIMAFLTLVHAISVLFALPFLLIYCLFHIKYLLKEWKLFSLFLVVPLIGLILYASMLDISLSSAVGSLIEKLQFHKGWGVYEVDNSPLEIYSIAGYCLAIAGAVVMLFSSWKKYFVYVLWPLCVLGSIAIFRISDVSYLSPYQRNVYYFGIALPFLSAFGLYFILKWAGKLSEWCFDFFAGLKKRYRESGKMELIKKIVKIAVILVLACCVIACAFGAHYKYPENMPLYKAIDSASYEALSFLSTQEKSNVMATLYVSLAVYPVARMDPVGALNFYGDKGAVSNFFAGDNCTIMEKILSQHDAKYVVAQQRIDCNWTNIYEKNAINVYKAD